MHGGGQRDRHPQGPGDDGVGLYEEAFITNHMEGFNYRFKGHEKVMNFSLLIIRKGLTMGLKDMKKETLK